ncbi:hypothetical protein HU830_03275 [Lactobacillus sp. DCY120]|uniref:RNA polymerase sigma-70 region 2 domain-containing protein n=1 Tax=Bombilactobacillus apium TaxID=2675299 RepID=A0A850RBM6_9LACO|nr:hypothetical protein [Bombilactobacillus apium]NVY96198.1 hypothetical protein [Bombilactobacillus apium]
MKRLHTLTHGFELAQADQRLIGGALKKAGLSAQSPDYEDLFQEAQILYAQTWAQVEVELATFRPYIFQKIVWRTWDYFRRQTRQQEHEQLLTATQTWDQLTTGQTPQFVLEQLQQVWPQLDSWAQIVLQENLLQGRALKQIAAEHQVSDRYLRKVRQQLRERLRRELNVKF